MTDETKKPSATVKAVIVVALIAAVAIALVARKGANNNAAEVKQADVHDSAVQVSATSKTSRDTDEMSKALEPTPTQPRKVLPKLVDLGAGKCIPCKMMAPILEELKEEYKDEFDVVFIDVWENEEAGEPYNIRMIPTQIFFDADGRELFRHEGFFSKEDILGKWKELGIEFSGGASASEVGNSGP